MASASQWWLSQIGRVPMLTPAEEIELGTAIQRWLTHPAPCPPGIRRRGLRARERFVSANLRLAASYVQKRCQRLAALNNADDLVQAANEGLIKAVERFDPTRGYRFSTYAYWWIRQSVGAWCDRHGRVVAIPGSHHQLLGRLAPTIRRLEQELHRTPTTAEIAAALGISMPVMEQLLINAKPVASLDSIIGDDGQELGETIASYDPTIEDLDDQAERLLQAEQLESMLQRLPASDQRLITVAYQLDGETRTRQDVARTMGMGARAVETKLRQVEQELRGMVVQLVLVAAPNGAIHANKIRPRWKKQRRIRTSADQLVFPLLQAASTP